MALLYGTGKRKEGRKVEMEKAKLSLLKHLGARNLRLKGEIVKYARRTLFIFARMDFYFCVKGVEQKGEA